MQLFFQPLAVIVRRLKLLLCRPAFPQDSRGGMVGRAAYGAGLALPEFPGQQSALAAVVSLPHGQIFLLGPVAVLQGLCLQTVQPFQLRRVLLPLFQKFQAALQPFDQPDVFLRQRKLLPCLLRRPFQCGKAGFLRLFFLRQPGGLRLFRVQTLPVPLAQLIGRPQQLSTASRRQRGLSLLYGALFLQKPGQLLFPLFQLVKALVPIAPVGDGGGQGFQLAVQRVAPAVRFFFQLGFIGVQPPQRFQQLIGVLCVRLVLFQPFPVGKFRLRADLARFGHDAQVQFPLHLRGGGAFFLGLLLQIGVKRGVEQLLEQLFAVIGLGVEDLQKIALSDHHRLGELILTQADQFLRFGLHLVRPRPAFAGVQFRQLSGGLLFHQIVPPAALAQVGRIPFQAIGVLTVLKYQLHIGIRVPGGIVRPKGFGRAAFPAPGTLAVKSEADSVENGGLARARVAGDEKNAIFAKLGKVDRCRFRVGAEGRKGQFQRLHRISPSSSFRRLRRISICRGPGGQSLFCSR